jgi:hypothetical protein
MTPAVDTAQRKKGLTNWGPLQKQKFLCSPTNAYVFCGPFRQTRMRPVGR